MCFLIYIFSMTSKMGSPEFCDFAIAEVNAKSSKLCTLALFQYNSSFGPRKKYTKTQQIASQIVKKPQENRAILASTITNKSPQNPVWTE